LPASRPLSHPRARQRSLATGTRPLCHPRAQHANPPQVSSPAPPNLVVHLRNDLRIGWFFDSMPVSVLERDGVIPTGRNLDLCCEGRPVGILLISCAAPSLACSLAPPTPRAYQSATWAAGITWSRRRLGGSETSGGRQPGPLWSRRCGTSGRSAFIDRRKAMAVLDGVEVLHAVSHGDWPRWLVIAVPAAQPCDHPNWRGPACGLDTLATEPQ
jgi:hypothetical protein